MPVKKKTTTRKKKTVSSKTDKKVMKRVPDFLEADLLSRYISERGRIFPRSRTELSATEQRRLTRAIKRARFLALLPYTVKPR